MSSQSTAALRNRPSRNSVVELFDNHSSATSCGYCKGARAVDGRQKENRGAHKDDSSDSDCGIESSLSLGMWGHQLTVDDYVGLVNRGWRRSGRYLYKPIMAKTCCPQYTIRLDVNNFRLSRTQKRVLRNMNQFLIDDKKPSSKVVENGNGCAAGPVEMESDTKQPESASERPKKEKAEQIGDDYQLPTKKKQMRRKRCFEKLAEKGIDIDEHKRQRAEKEANRRRTIASYILPYQEGHKHKLEVLLVREGSQIFQDYYDEEVDLYLKYQRVVHNDPKSSRRGFEGFLVNSPLVFEQGDDEFPGFGSFHQLYLLDGKLIAVGVIDLLPLCLSSKYCFYDPDYAFLALGTYCALREIEFTQSMHELRPEVQYYYMGYYLEECPKMKYKGRFRPSDLMCDKTFKWMPLKEAIAKINANDNRFTVLYPDDERPAPPSLDEIRIISKDSTTAAQRLMSARMYKMMNPDDQDFEATMAEYLDLAGPVASEICIYRNLPPNADE